MQHFIQNVAYFYYNILHKKFNPRWKNLWIKISKKMAEISLSLEGRGCHFVTGEGDKIFYIHPHQSFAQLLPSREKREILFSLKPLSWLIYRCFYNATFCIKCCTKIRTLIKKAKNERTARIWEDWADFPWWKWWSCCW